MSRQPIPFANEPRPDTGLRSGRLGLWLVLASEVMLFAGLFSALAFLRIGSTTWPTSALEHGLPLINSVVLAASVLVIVMAGRSVTRHDGEFRLLWSLGLALGLLVLFIRSAEWSILLGMGRTPASHNLFGIYFVLTGLHALFLAGNMVVNGWILLTGAPMTRIDPARHRERVYGAIVQWLVLVVIWFVIMIGFFV
jgi:cytochrome c oxidase subunit 3